MKSLSQQHEWLAQFRSLYLATGDLSRCFGASAGRLSVFQRFCLYVNPVCAAYLALANSAGTLDEALKVEERRLAKAARFDRQWWMRFKVALVITIVLSLLFAALDSGLTGPSVGVFWEPIKNCAILTGLHLGLYRLILHRHQWLGTSIGHTVLIGVGVWRDEAKLWLFKSHSMLIESGWPGYDGFHELARQCPWRHLGMTVSGIAHLIEANQETLADGYSRLALLDANDRAAIRISDRVGELSRGLSQVSRDVGNRLQGALDSLKSWTLRAYPVIAILLSF